MTIWQLFDPATLAACPGSPRAIAWRERIARAVPIAPGLRPALADDRR